MRALSAAQMNGKIDLFSYHLWEEKIADSHSIEDSLRGGSTDGSTTEVATFVERICQPDPGRYALLPIRHPKLWTMYKQHEASFWTAEEVWLRT